MCDAYGRSQSDANNAASCDGSVSLVLFSSHCKQVIIIIIITRMWATAQGDGRPVEHRWRPVLNATKFGSRPLL